MAGILVYALHDDEGNFNKNSLGAISEAAKLALVVWAAAYLARRPAPRTLAITFSRSASAAECALRR